VDNLAIPPNLDSYMGKPIRIVGQHRVVHDKGPFAAPFDAVGPCQRDALLWLESLHVKAIQVGGIFRPKLSEQERRQGAKAVDERVAEAGLKQKAVGNLRTLVSCRKRDPGSKWLEESAFDIDGVVASREPASTPCSTTPRIPVAGGPIDVEEKQIARRAGAHVMLDGWL
jgi:hypothetical protein